MRSLGEHLPAIAAVTRKETIPSESLRRTENRPFVPGRWLAEAPRDRLMRMPGPLLEPIVAGPAEPSIPFGSATCP